MNCPPLECPAPAPAPAGPNNKFLLVDDVFYNAYQAQLGATSGNVQNAWMNIYNQQKDQQYGVATYPGANFYMGPFIRKNPNCFDIISKNELNKKSYQFLQTYDFIVDYQINVGPIDANYFDIYKTYMTSGEGGALFFYGLMNNTINNNLVPFISQLGGGSLDTFVIKDSVLKSFYDTYKNNIMPTDSSMNLNNSPGINIDNKGLYRNRPGIKDPVTAINSGSYGKPIYNFTYLAKIWKAGTLRDAPKSRLILYGASSPFLTPAPGLTESNINDTDVKFAENIKALLRSKVSGIMPLDYTTEPVKVLKGNMGFSAGYFNGHAQANVTFGISDNRYDPLNYDLNSVYASVSRQFSEAGQYRTLGIGEPPVIIKLESLNNSPNVFTGSTNPHDPKTASDGSNVLHVVDGAGGYPPNIWFYITDINGVQWGMADFTFNRNEWHQQYIGFFRSGQGR